MLSDYQVALLEAKDHIRAFGVGTNNRSHVESDVVQSGCHGSRHNRLESRPFRAGKGQGRFVIDWLGKVRLRDWVLC